MRDVRCGKVVLVQVFARWAWCGGKETTIGARGDGESLLTRSVVLAANPIFKSSALTNGTLLQRNQTHLFAHVDGEHRYIGRSYATYSGDLTDGFWFVFL